MSVLCYKIKRKGKCHTIGKTFYDFFFVFKFRREIFHRGVLCLIAKEHIHENSLDIYIAMKIKF